MKFKSFFFNYLFLFLFLFSFSSNVQATNIEEGKILFSTHCMACHQGGNNLIIPEKNLKKQTLEANGMYSITAIMYQVINGKNGMPAFGGRLREEDIETIAYYVLQESSINFGEVPEKKSQK